MFLIFAQKHRLWVLVRTINKNSITIFHLKIVVFTAVKYCSILRRRVCVMVMNIQSHSLFIFITV